MARRRAGGVHRALRASVRSRWRRLAAGSGPGRPATRIARGLIVPVALALLTTGAAPGLIRIQPGDSLWLLARRYGTTVEALRALNHLPGDTIYAGRTLLVPGLATGTRTHPVTVDARYRVQAGDTVGAIAAGYRVRVEEIVARNGLDAAATIYVGQLLRVPVTVLVPAAAASPPGPTALTAAVARSRALLAARPVPARSAVRALIAATAAELGVDRALALAVAQYESGFQQNVVSPADAIGAMQVLPSTGRWLASDVLGRPLDLLEVGDNVLAGIALLRLLTTSAPLADAVAGYYQGLASVRRHGMYPDTRRYVAGVLALRQRWQR